MRKLSHSTKLAIVGFIIGLLPGIFWSLPEICRIVSYCSSTVEEIVFAIGMFFLIPMNIAFFWFPTGGHPPLFVYFPLVAPFIYAICGYLIGLFIKKLRS